MAVEMFLKLDGIAGGSRNYHHKGWADMISWQWAVQGASALSADALPRMNELTLTKALGMESPTLMSLCAQGKRVASAEIHVVPVVSKRDAQQKYLALTLEDLRITSIETGGGLDNNVFVETLTLEFRRVRFEFNQYAASGPDDGAQQVESYSFGWDVVANQAW